MDITINLQSLENEDIKVDAIKLQKMLFLFNTIELGWSVKKQNNSYIFKKNHENKNHFDINFRDIIY